MMILSGRWQLRRWYACSVFSSDTHSPFRISSFRSCTVAREYQCVKAASSEPTNAATELDRCFASWYVSMPQIMVRLIGTRTPHNDPPSLQFICSSTFSTTDRLRFSFASVRALMTCDGIGTSVQRMRLIAAYRSSRDVGQMITTIWVPGRMRVRSACTYRLVASCGSTSVCGWATSNPSSLQVRFTQSRNTDTCCSSRCVYSSIHWRMWTISSIGLLSTFGPALPTTPPPDVMFSGGSCRPIITFGVIISSSPQEESSLRAASFLFTFSQNWRIATSRWFGVMRVTMLASPIYTPNTYLMIVSHLIGQPSEEANLRHQANNHLLRLGLPHHTPLRPVQQQWLLVVLNFQPVLLLYSTYEMSRSPYRNVLSGFVSKHTSSMRYVFLLYRVSTTAPSSDLSTFSRNCPPRAWASILMCVYTVVCISTRCVTSRFSISPPSNSFTAVTNPGQISSLCCGMMRACVGSKCLRPISDSCSMYMMRRNSLL
uniref:Uncharacterized protein n=1 Tax=Anopheles melas TaxID=34690 RepID=A0A182UEZ6_9DIPT